MNDIQQTIQEQLSTYPIVLYMKGSPVAPRCGFSAKACELLHRCLEEAHADATQVKYVDVLADPDIREGIKVYGQWPTIPQLYIRSELIGGSDILEELFNQGELQKQVAAAFK